MSNVILSICIPTYKREKILIKSLKDHLLHCPEKKIEIVVYADGPTFIIESFIKEINDSRIKFYKGKQRLGIDNAIIRCVELSSGVYILLLSDEDYLEWKSVLWLIDIIKKKKNLSQIIGPVEYYENGIHNYYYNFDKKTGGKDMIWKAGHHSLINFFCSHGYLSGLCLKKSSLDLNKVKKYVGSLYMCDILAAFAMLNGDTLITSKIFCYWVNPIKI